MSSGGGSKIVMLRVGPMRPRIPVRLCSSCCGLGARLGWCKSILLTTSGAVLWGIAACKSIEAISAGNVQVAVYMDDISIMATCAADLQLASGAAAHFMQNWH
eukprot:66189-Amphidinium_carterae.1